MYKSYKQSGRLIFRSYEVKSIKVDQLKSIENKGEKQKKLPVAELANQSNQILNKSADQISKLPPKFQFVMHNNIVKYFNTSADRFDTNQEKGLSTVSEAKGEKNEFAKYKTAMKRKLEEIIKKYAPSKEDLEKQKEAQKDRKKATESMAKAASQKPEDIRFDATKLSTPKGIEGEANKLINKSKGLQKIGDVLNQSVADFQKALTAFNEAKKGWSVFLRGSPFTDDPETKRMQKMHQDLKNTLLIKIGEIEKGQTEVKVYGKKVNAAPEGLKEKQLKAREENKKKIEDAKLNQQKNAKATTRKRQQYKRLKQQHEDLAARKADLDDYETSLQAHARDAEQKEQVAASKVDTKGQQLDQFGSKLDGAIRIIDDALAKPGLTDHQKQQLQKHRVTLLGHKMVAESGRQELGATKGKQEAVAQQRSAATQSKLSSVSAGRLSLDTHMTGVVKPALTTLDSSLGVLRKAAKANRPVLDQLMEEKVNIDKSIVAIDKADEVVSGTVLDVNLDNQKLVDGLEKQNKDIRSLSIDRPNLWDATGGLLLNQIGTGLNLVSEHVFDNIVKLVDDYPGKIPVIGTALRWVTHSSIGMLSGAFTAGGELVSGIAQLIGSPIETAKGLAALAPWRENAGTAWKEMGKAIFAVDEFQKGKYGKGVGKIAANIVMTIMGGGAVSNGVRAGTLAGRVAARGAIKAGSWQITAVAKGVATGIGTGSVEVAKELALIAPKVAKGAVGILKAPITLYSRLKMGKLGRLDADITKHGKQLSEATDASRTAKLSNGTELHKIDQLKGLNYDQLKALKPKDLADMGITKPKDVITFMKYRKAVQVMEKAKSMVKTMKMNRTAARAQQAVDDADVALGSAQQRGEALFRDKRTERPDLGGRFRDQLATRKSFRKRKKVKHPDAERGSSQKTAKKETSSTPSVEARPKVKAETQGRTIFDLPKDAKGQIGKLLRSKAKGVLSDLHLLLTKIDNPRALQNILTKKHKLTDLEAQQIIDILIENKKRIVEKKVPAKKPKAKKAPEIYEATQFDSLLQDNNMTFDTLAKGKSKEALRRDPTVDCLDVNSDRFDHHHRAGEDVSATDLVVQQRAEILSSRGRIRQIVSHKSADADSIASTSLYLLIRDGKITGTESAVRRLVRHVNAADLGKWKQMSFDTPDLSYLIGRIKEQFPGQNAMHYRIGFEIIRRIIARHLDPSNLKYSDFSDIILRKGKKKTFSLGESIKGHRKLRQKQVDKFKRVEAEGAFDLPGGGRGIRLDGVKSIDNMEIYARGYDVIFTGESVFFKPEFATRRRTLELHRRLEIEESKIRREMAAENPEKYNNPEFLRTETVRPGYEGRSAETGGNSNPWHHEADYSYIVQPGKSEWGRSQIPQARIAEIIMSTLQTTQ